MREMVFRERTEKVAHVRAMATVAARFMNLDVNRVFGDVIADYAAEVFQESYDPTLLTQKRDRLREAQARVRQRRLDDLRAISRLERIEQLGDAWEKRGKNKGSNRAK